MTAALIAVSALLLRWYEPLSPPDADYAVMVPMTAAGVLLAAGALLVLSRFRTRKGLRGAARAAAFACLAIGIVVLSPHFGTGSPGAMQPGAGWWNARPGPLTAIGLACAGFALLALASPHAAAPRLASGAAAAVLVVALTAWIGHLYGEAALYRVDPWSATAPSTILALASLAAGMLFANPARGVALLAASDSSGGRLLRRLLPAAVFAPMLLGWAVLAWQASAHLRYAFATAILVVSLIVLLVALVVRQASVLHALDAERERLLAGARGARDQVTRILESITDAFFSVDPEWRFVYVNREAERLLRRSRTELIGRNLWSEYPDALGEVFEREYRQAVEAQRTIQFETYYAPLEIWIEVRAYPSPNGLSVYFHDVSARKAAQEELVESERNFRALANSIPQFAWMADPDGNIFWYSDRWYEYTGTTLEQMRGWGWTAVHHPDHVQRVVERIRRSFESGEPWEDTFPLRSRTGEYRWFLSRAQPIRDAEGNVLRWFGTNTDITEQRRAGEERERLLQKAQEARADAELKREALQRMTESRASLMRGFGHDVKNPLGTAHMHAQLLERGLLPGELSDKQRDSVHVIRRSIREAVQLIDDLLELAHAEAGQVALDCVPADAGEILREAAGDFRQQAVAARLQLEVHAQHDAHALADPARLRQILGNLLSNAAKYAPDGRLDLAAVHRTSGGPRPGGWIALSVADSGPGIPLDKQEAIFHEYVRLDPDAAPGAGIGLAISRHFARLMGGDLTVSSEPGYGSTFTIWLPAIDRRGTPQQGSTHRSGH